MDAWSSKVDYLKGLAQRAWDPASTPKVPTGFPDTFVAASWAAFLQGMFLERVVQLRATQDDVDAIYADHTEAAMIRWRASGGPALPSAFQQMLRALDAVVIEGAGLDATYALSEQIRNLLASANPGMNAPFPNPPPTGSRQRMLTWSPLQFARFVAVGVVTLPYAEAVRQQVHVDVVNMADDVLARSAWDAVVVETLASHVMLQPGARGTNPGRLSDFRAILDDTEAYLKLPEMRTVPASVGTGIRYLREQIEALSTPIDTIPDLPARAEEAVDDAVERIEDTIKSGATIVGSFLAGVILFVAVRGSRRPPPPPPPPRDVE